MIGHNVRLVLHVFEDDIESLILWCEQNVGNYRQNKWIMEYGKYNKSQQTVTFTFERAEDATMFALKFMKTN